MDMTSEALAENWRDKVTLNDSRVVAKAIADEVAGKLEDLLHGKDGQEIAFPLYITAHFPRDEVRANRVLGAGNEEAATRLLDKLAATGLVRVTQGDDGLPYLSIVSARTRDVILNALKTSFVEKFPRYSIEEAQFHPPYEGYRPKYPENALPSKSWQQKRVEEKSQSPAQDR